MILTRLFKKKSIRAYWWRSVANFGDALAPLLLSRFADIDRIDWSPVADAEIVSIGSVLEHIPSGWRGYIVGSGRLRESALLKFDPEDAKILALRGPLSARGIFGSFALGDPGLLANELIEHQPKQWDIGILPHWLDTELVPRFKKLIPARESIKLISAKDDPLEVLRAIASCKKIVTSSLHGMIAADALGIPRRVEVCKKLEKEGGTFKFRDYSASIQTRFEPGKLTEPSRNRVNDARFEIYDAYRELSRAYGKS
jgi:hypothetical protein